MGDHVDRDRITASGIEFPDAGDRLLLRSGRLFLRGEWSHRNEGNNGEREKTRHGNSAMWGGTGAENGLKDRRKGGRPGTGKSEVERRFIRRFDRNCRPAAPVR